MGVGFSVAIEYCRQPRGLKIGKRTFLVGLVGGGGGTISEGFLMRRSSSQ